ncbi:phosphate:Na+ symporter [Spirosoma lacussanchae]|uniref:Na/Pi cotransporter family protein n=1 Tax=Spirosoma lacussanchae TaxID=1884249 RepID=UPI0011089E73|nr:Na/Pi symporter [Spirosoma lacussanchae]
MQAYLPVLLPLLSGLVLFLFALNYLSDGLKAISGEQLNQWLSRFTSNVATGILTGVVITILLDSSSAVIIMAIALVNTRALSFRQALGVVLGANIGTTFSSQLIAFDVGQWAGLPMAVGLGLMVLSHRDWLTQSGQVLLGLGMLFLGLYLMEDAVEPLKHMPTVTRWMQGLDNPGRGALVGAGVTVLLQSSSATVGMAVVLEGQQLLTLPAGIALMMGAELGTCADTLVASIGRSRAALRTGLFHLVFNVFSIGLGLLLIDPFTALIKILSAGAPAGRQLANAHVLFNVIGVALVVGFVPIIATWLERWLPDVSADGAQPKMK